MDDLISEFLSETGESLAVLDAELVKLDQNPGDRDILSTIFRLVHTIKGTCGFLGLARLEAVAEAVEQVLGQIERGEMAVTQSTSFVVLEALARIKNIMEYLEEQGEEPQGDDNDLIAHLHRLSENQAAPVRQETPRAHLSQSFFADPDPRLPSLAMGHGAPAILSPQAKQEAIRQGLKTDAPVESKRGLLEKLAWAVGELIATRHQLKAIGPQEKLAAPMEKLNEVTRALADSLRAAQGTEKLPIEVTSVLLVQTAAQRLALPERYVLELLDLALPGEWRIETIHHTRVLLFGRRVVPLVSLASLLRLTAHYEEKVAIVKVGEAEFALAFERLGELEEAVQRPLPRLLARLGVYRGATMVGDEKPVLVLDPAGLARAIGYRQVNDVAPLAKPRVAASPDKLRGFLLFRAGAGAPKALLLDDVTRVDEVSPHAPDIRLAMLPGTQLPKYGACEVVVLADKNRTGKPISLAVEEVLEVMQAPFALNRDGANLGYLGTVTIGGHEAELVDVERLRRMDIREAA